MKKLVLLTGAFVLSIGWASAQSLTRLKLVKATETAVKNEKIATPTADLKTGKKADAATGEALPAAMSLVESSKTQPSKKASKN